MKAWKKLLLGLGGLLAVCGLSVAGYAWSQAGAYEESMSVVYDVPVPDLAATGDPQALERGKHLARSLGSCALSECHGADLAGGRMIEMGPIGQLTGPNITGAGLGAAYSDGELARLILHGVKKDGRSVAFMPSHEFNWLPDDDIVALLSYIRSVPDVNKSNGVVQVGILGKVLDRRDEFHMDIARRIDHQNIERAPSPSPTREYGKYIGRFCVGCHGKTYSGGAIPGAPPSIPVPTNITPHEQGMKDWSYVDFVRLLDEGIKKDGKKLDPFMPLEALSNMNETERKALWAFLRSVPPKPSGNR